eukprot:10332039-Karenia_brevis.AAC.1
MVGQRTKAVFFPLHLKSAQVWWRMASLGYKPAEWQLVVPHGEQIRVGAPGASLGQLQKVRGHRCCACGLLLLRQVDMFNHVREAHRARLKHVPMLQWVQQVVRERRLFEPQRPVPAGNDNLGRNAFASFAYQQQGVQTISLQTAISHLGLYGALLEHVFAADALDGNGHVIAPWLSKNDWCRAIWVLGNGPLRRILEHCVLEDKASMEKRSFQRNGQAAIQHVTCSNGKFSIDGKSYFASTESTAIDGKNPSMGTQKLKQNRNNDKAKIGSNIK